MVEAQSDPTLVASGLRRINSSWRNLLISVETTNCVYRVGELAIPNGIQEGKNVSRLVLMTETYHLIIEMSLFAVWTKILPEGCFLKRILR
ncbi:hypothetical protein RSAG8_11344, partial [Rhizoctonia solani AG-8 WAC10335]